MSKPLCLYTAPTPNGLRVSIFLEELKSAYGLSYELKPLDLRAGSQKEPWYLKINPSGQIPCIVDHANGDYALSETSAILLYLQKHYDTEGKFGFKEGTNEYFDVLRWLFFIHGGIASDAVNYFRMKRGQENADATKERIRNQLKQAFGVLDAHLATGKEWLAGDKYSIADMNAAPFILGHVFADIPSLDEWPNMKAWLGRISERPQYKSGENIP